MLDFDENRLRKNLQQLPAPSRVAFAASAAQRLASVYRKLLEQIGQDDSADSCDDALDYVWSHILTPPETQTVGRLLHQIMALIPDEDAPGWTPLRSYGGDGLSAVAYALRCLQSGEASEAAWAARCVYEAVDFFVTSRAEAGAAQEADSQSSPDLLVRSELQRQSRDIADLSSNALSQPMLSRMQSRSLAEQAIASD